MSAPRSALPVSIRLGDLNVQHLMFDVDGTLIQSQQFDTELFSLAVFEETGIEVDTNWSKYAHATDAGLLQEILATAEYREPRDQIAAAVKKNFCSKIAQHLEAIPVMEVAGARQLLLMLMARDDLHLSIATGGWFETARLKLQSADLWFPQIPVASPSDHFDRCEIMQIAAARAIGNKNLPCTYFGDGDWDKRACAQLGYNFVLVGNLLDHTPQIENFVDAEMILKLLEL